MSDIEQPQTTLRETLEANLDASEAGTLPSIEEVKVERPRDEVGRFAQKPKEEVTPKVEAPKVEAQPDPLQALRPTTWKKEYLPLWDKAATGQPLTTAEWKKLAEYNGQRENEYKTGVSTYKAEATAAKELQDAITPFLPELQANGIQPSAWIKQLGQAHHALAKGTPELKMQVFRELARQYNVPLGAVVQQGQVPPIVNDLMGMINDLRQQVSGVTTWRQQQETNSLTSEIAKFQDVAKYPHFPVVREKMAQLLETGLARDLDDAYKQSVRLNDELYEAEKLQAVEATRKPQAVAQARAHAVSPKSATPSGQVATGAKDRRAVLEDRFDSLAGGRV